jgi:Fungal specific transcription factor domain
MHTPRTSAPRVEYELPSRRTADNLLRIYWESVYPIFPFVDRQEFETIYANIWSGAPSESDESLHICTLNVVFALASQYSETITSNDHPPTAGKFFDRAQDLLNLDLWSQGSVELIQCLLLMAQYLQSANSLHQCWMVGGLATRMAEGLGLHLPEMSEQASSTREREHLRVIWHGCVLLDRYVAQLCFDIPTGLTWTEFSPCNLADQLRLTR